MKKAGCHPSVLRHKDFRPALARLERIKDEHARFAPAAVRHQSHHKQPGTFHIRKINPTSIQLVAYGCSGLLVEGVVYTRNTAAVIAALSG